MNSNPLLPSKITKSVSPILNGKYDLVSLTKDNNKSERISVNRNYVIVLPFERTEDQKIKSIYGISFENPVSSKEDVTLITGEVDLEKDTTAYDSVGRILLEEAGLNIDDAGLIEDDIFYLGIITTVEPVFSKFKCYAVDLTKISRPDHSIDFTRNLSNSIAFNENSEVVKIGFHQVVNGDYSDACILSSCFLLVSYFN